MSMVTQAYRLDIIPFGPPVIVPVSQYDVGSRTLSFTIYNGQSSVFNIPSGATATIGGTKSDGKAFQYLCTISGNIVSCDVTEQMTAAEGFSECEIAIMKDDERLATANFRLHVERAAMDESLISDSDLAAIPDLTNKAISAANAASASQTAAASSASAAARSASDASSSASSANTSASNAGKSANSASTSAGNASTSEKNAKTSADNASKSADASANSAKASADSASAASKSQTAAASSASAAADSAAAAKSAADSSAYTIGKDADTGRPALYHHTA